MWPGLEQQLQGGSRPRCQVPSLWQNRKNDLTVGQSGVSLREPCQKETEEGTMQGLPCSSL